MLEIGSAGCRLKTYPCRSKKMRTAVGLIGALVLIVLSVIQMSTADSQKQYHGSFAMIIISLIVALGVAF
jgi:hypothetical protein